MRAERLAGNPIIHCEMDASLEGNCNGPSLIRAPEWIDRPLGRYYLYFAHHRGSHIRLATADRLEGPWSIHAAGTLRLDQTDCHDHIASPDVHVDRERERIRMYFHGPAFSTPAESDGHERQLGEAAPWVGTQRSKLALSRDGLHFSARPEVLGAPYFRCFCWRGAVYALAMPGVFYRSADGLTAFERGPILFTERLRHPAVHIAGDTLHVFWSNAGDCPERILHATIDLRGDWMAWRPSAPETLLEPELEHEGAALPLEPSRRGLAEAPVRQLRDPGVFEEDGELYLLYSVAGEQGIAIARLLDS